MSAWPREQEDAELEEIDRVVQEQTQDDDEELNREAQEDADIDPLEGLGPNNVELL